MRYLTLPHEFLRLWGQGLTLALLVFMVPAIGAAQIPGTYLTTADVNVRKGPSTSYQAVTTIPKGIKVHVVAKEGEWLRIESKHGKQPGYISERYARPLQVQAQQAYEPRVSNSFVSGAYRTTMETDLRDGPGLNYKVVTRLPADIKVNVVRAEGNWLRVESKHGKKPGYVDKRAVEPWGSH